MCFAPSFHLQKSDVYATHWLNQTQHKVGLVEQLIIYVPGDVAIRSKNTLIINLTDIVIIFRNKGFFPAKKPMWRVNMFVKIMFL